MFTIIDNLKFKQENYRSLILCHNINKIYIIIKLKRHIV